MGNHHEPGYAAPVAGLGRRFRPGRIRSALHHVDGQRRSGSAAQLDRRARQRSGSGYLMRIFTILIGAMLTLAAHAARADIYAYIDEKGDAHFAVEKVDERYQLYLKGDQSFDS